MTLTEFAQVLAEKAADHAQAEDAAFLAHDKEAEARQGAAKDALTWALAEYLDTDDTTAFTAIAEIVEARNA